MNNKVWPKGLGVLVLVLLTVNCRADSDPYRSASPNQGAYAPPTRPVFRSEAPLRPEGTGVDIGVYGGITPFQNGHIDLTSPGIPLSIKGSTKSRLGEVAGIRVGYTWPSFGALPGTQSYSSPSADPAWCMPAVEYDLFWSGLDYKANDASFGSGGKVTADMDLITLSVDPMLKFRIGPLHPYVGLGIGGTYLSAGNAKINAPALFSASFSGSSNDVCFSLAPMIGTELFFSQHWALTAEYKYLYVVDPTLRAHWDTSVGSLPLNFHSDGLGLQMVTAGLKFYF